MSRDLGYTNTDERCFIAQNLILLILKFYVYRHWQLDLTFFHKLVKNYNLENGTALRNRRKLDVHKKNGHL